MLRKFLDLFVKYETYTSPPEPETGTIRIVPFDVNSFRVERFEWAYGSGYKGKRNYRHWRTLTDGTKKECEDWVKDFLKAEAHTKAEIDRHNEAIRKHHTENPPRIVTLDENGNLKTVD